ncbi:N-acetylneuraminate synthase [Dasania marina]|uniref:N-acetylneuraminate synthase n=1 Tax=Dasania marina TaxID=471499 RepID=UPI0030DBD504|tara:strand:- start:53844 stop:54926 length:1083 start_codon:yes stop_codon:yes gene_type:complete
MSPVYIIAEAGVNHNGNAELAYKLVDAAVASGADAVKFQTFKADRLVTRSAVKASYQCKTTDAAESQYQMLKRLELSEDLHRELMAYCKQKGIDFLSTAFDEDSLQFLNNDLGLKTLKIPSGELTNAPLVLAHARVADKLIVSTGMANLEEIESALSVIAYGYTHAEDRDLPSETLFKKAYLSPEGMASLKDNVILLHCTTEYPAPMQDINLKAMDAMGVKFGLPIGYSDHSQGITIPIAAAARGAVLIEKHFTLDKTMDGPDHQASLEPSELTAMVNAIRAVEEALGDGQKTIRPSELANKNIARKSLVAVTNIAKGDTYSADNLCVKRPGGGMSPINFWQLLGQPATKNFKAGDLIDE